MNIESQNIMKKLKQDCFKKIVHNGIVFEEGAAVYAKEIDKNIFLVFTIKQHTASENIQAFIAQFDSWGSIGKKEPLQMMFSLSVKDKNDLHYFEKFINVSETYKIENE